MKPFVVTFLPVVLRTNRPTERQTDVKTEQVLDKAKGAGV